MSKHNQACTANQPEVSESLAHLGLDERAWRVLDARLGFTERLTLDETAGLIGGVTRERARQIQKAASRQANQRLFQLEPALAALEAAENKLAPVRADDFTLDKVVRKCKRALTAAGWSKPSANDVRRLLLAIRASAACGRSLLQARYPHTFYIACLLPPPIEAHPEAGATAAKWAREEKERRREWTYKELAVSVLRAVGEPLHWSEIADRAELLGHRKNFSESTMHNALCDTHDTFARTDQGAYGLIEWGIESVDFYHDIIANALREAQRTLTLGQLLHLVGEIRPIEKPSLQMFLDTHPRFYSSREEEYGLRAWLPPRDKQTLRTPKCLVEDPDSYLRVERAAARGYDVEKIVAQDRRDNQEDEASP